MERANKGIVLEFYPSLLTSAIFYINMGQCTRFQYLSHQWAVKAKASWPPSLLDALALMFIRGIWAHKHLNPVYWPIRVSKWDNCTLTLCILMDFPIYIDTMSMGLPILYFKGSQVEITMYGSQVEITKLRCISVPEGCFNPSTQCRPWWNEALCCISSVSSLFAKVPVKGISVYKG